jgi:hypothetical protein
MVLTVRGQATAPSVSQIKSWRPIMCVGRGYPAGKHR